MDYGCIITSILLPDAKTWGGFVDVNLGFGSLDSWVHRNQPNFGALVGRYANRIKGGTFTLDGHTYQLDKNNLGNCLHGGTQPYGRRPWRGDECLIDEWHGVSFHGRSPAGDQGFPGNLDLSVSYLLNDDNELRLLYVAKTDAPTPLNLTNHAYLNRAGHKSGSVAGHVCQIHGDAQRLEVDPADLVPTGKILGVKGTAFDLSVPTPFADRFGHPDLAGTNGGYDVCYVWQDGSKINDWENLDLIERATVTDSASGRSVTCLSTQPCCQLYTSNNSKPPVGKDGFTYDQYGAFCLETAQYTNAPNISAFPSGILRPGDTYAADTVYRFGF
jgi:aldose 1-epimerase